MRQRIVEGPYDELKAKELDQKVNAAAERLEDEGATIVDIRHVGGSDGISTIVIIYKPKKKGK